MKPQNATSKLYKFETHVNNTDLPDVVKRYFKAVLPEEFETFDYVEIHSRTHIKLTRNSEFAPIEGVERINTNHPCFLYTASMNLFPGIYVWVREEYQNHIAWGYASILSLFPVRDEKSQDLSRVALFRYGSELLMAPFALVPGLSNFVSWQGLDDSQAELTIDDGHNHVVAIVKFRQDGTILSFTTQDVILGKTWIFWIDQYQDFNFNGKFVKIGSVLRATFKYGENDQYDYLEMTNATLVVS